MQEYWTTNHCSRAQDSCFLNAFGADGFLTDSCEDNLKVSTSEVTFVLTSNFAAEELMVGTTDDDDAAVLAAEAAVAAARGQWTEDRAGRRNPFLRPEARGRVDRFVHFFP